MRSTIRLLLLAAAFLSLPAAAQAATPFTAGAGIAPTVAVGADGTGHVVWQTVADDTQVGYCRISAGGTGCNRTELLSYPGLTDANRAGKAQVFAPAPNKVVIVASCWNCLEAGITDRTYRWISENNGSSFGGPVLIGTGTQTNGFGLWLDGEEDFVGTSSARVKAAMIDGTDGVEYATSGIFVYGPEVARLAGATKLVAATNDLDVVKYGVYKGPNLLPTSINAPANWETDRTLPSAEPDNSDTALNSGPNGIGLTYRYFVPNDTRVGLRRFDPGTNSFGAPVYLEGTDPIDDNGLAEPDSFQDTSGRIHVVWSTLHDGGRLRYTVSDTGGGSFSTVATLAKSDGFQEPEIAAGANGKGFVTWTPGFSGAIRVVPIDPQAESGSTSPPPGDTTPPGITGFDLDDTTLRPGQGARFSFRASEAGTAVLTFEKRFNGIRGKRKGKKACLPVSKKRLRALRRKGKKVKRCKGFRRIGQIRQRVKPGVNTIAFNGRIAGRKLKPGRYRAKLVVTDDAGQVSRTETLRFRVVKPKKRARR